MDHKEEPEDMQADKANNESHEHVQHLEIHIWAHRSFVRTIAFPVEVVDDEDGEEPESEVDPRDQHLRVCYPLDPQGNNVNCQLEYGYSEVCDIVNEHNDGSHGQHVQGVRKEDQRPCHEVVEEVLREV